MRDEELVIAAVNDALTDAGYKCSVRENAIYMPFVALELFARTPSFKDGPCGRAMTVAVEVRAESADSNGIRVIQVDHGLTDFEAARDAAVQWQLSFLPALITFIAQPDHRCDVDYAHVIVGDEETGERFGWRVHLPPILSRIYGEIELPPDPEQNAIFRALFDCIHPYTAHNQLFWVEAFTARYPERKVDATCRMNNEDWLEGRNALLRWATSWQDPGQGIVSRRQFLLFEPVPVDRIPNRGSWGE